MTNYERQQDFERKQNARLQSDISRLQEAANRTAGWADQVEKTKKGTRNSGLRPDTGYVGHKSAKMMKRAKVIEARRQNEIEEKSNLLKNTENESSLKISPLTYKSEVLVTFSSVVPIYDNKQVCREVSFEIKRGERIVLEGKNGSGKSSLLKLLLGQQIDRLGTISLGSNVVISYVPQETSSLQGTLTDIALQSRIDESLFKTILYKMGFDRRQFEKDTREFSDGQKKKTLIAKSLCEQAHLYVWDEPLNFVDVYSRIQIENLIKEFKPTMIFVEHDKAFQNSVATRRITL